MTRVVDVDARDGLAIWVQCDDWTTDKVDLDDLAGRVDVFISWADRRVFESVRVSDAALTCTPTLFT